MSSSKKARPVPVPGSQSRTGSGAQPGTARARLAAEQARRAQQRRRLKLVAVPVAVVLVAVVALVVVKLAGVGSPTSGPSATSGDDAVITAVTTVPTGVLDQVGAGTVTAIPKAIDAPALTADGKPKVLYVGAEYCPYCAAERWAMVVALSRFGTFGGLGQTASSANDIFPSTPTLTFHGSNYTSSTIAFTGVETESNEVANGGYAALDTLSGEDQQIFQAYDSPPYVDKASTGSIPFVDIGGKYLISGASYSPQVLQGKTHQQVAAALSDPNSDIAKGVDGTANLITAAICTSTADKPANVCTSAGVQAAAKKLG